MIGLQRHGSAQFAAPFWDAIGRIIDVLRSALDLPVASIVLATELPLWLPDPPSYWSASSSRAILDLVAATDDLLVVSDLQADGRFTSGAFAALEPEARALIVFPVAIGNSRLGAIFGLADRPRAFSEAERALVCDLHALAHNAFTLVERAAETETNLRKKLEIDRVFRDTFDQAPIGIAHTLFSGRLLRANAHLGALLGYSQERLRGMNFIDITHPDDVELNVRLLRELSAGEIDSYRMEKRFLRSDGSYLWTSLSVAAQRSAVQQQDFMIATVQDISERKRVESELLALRATLEREVTRQTDTLRERNVAMQVQVKQLLDLERQQRLAEQRLRTIADNMPALIAYWDDQARCRFANHAYVEWFGRSPDELIGTYLRDLLGDEGYASVAPRVEAVLAGRTQHFERALTVFDGSPRVAAANYVPDFDDSGNVRGFYTLVTDVTSLRLALDALTEINDRLSHEVAIDELTGLANRRVFNLRSQLAFGAFLEQREAGAFILLDIDHFKRVNDTHGHLVGDDVLRRVGVVLRRCARGESDVALRLGGEEFGLLCDGEFDDAELIALAERLRLALAAESVLTPTGSVSVTGSFGAARFERSDTGFKDVYARADAALYRAKACGRNTVVLAETRLLTLR